jgi:hypothetical protein
MSVDKNAKMSLKKRKFKAGSEMAAFKNMSLK